MPTTLPVPSKGALRTLRHLALGTSCTVALSAGLLTEDRRRRIHAAREVHDNAQKIKSSRKYHSAGTVAIETFEEQVSRLQDDAFWLPSNVARSKILNTSGSSKGPEKSKDHVRNVSRPSKYPDITWQSYRPPPFLSPTAPTVPELPKPRESKQAFHNRQHRLSYDVSKLLDEDPPDVGAATSRFLEAFEEGLGEEGSELLQSLIDTAIRLSEACRSQSSLGNCDRIFDFICSHGVLKEEHYRRFEPYERIARLLERPNLEDPVEISRLKKASSIYLTKFKEDPQAMTDKMVIAGEELCMECYNSGLYDVCVELHFRISKCGVAYSPRTTQYLIRATYERGEHKRMFRYFTNFFTRATPSTSEFYEVTSLVIDSLVKIKQFSKAEEVLVAAVPLAQRTGSSLSTTWFLKVLGSHWRELRDIVETRALFDRLKPPGKHPQVLYTAMIQCYVEARDEAAAVTLFEQMQFFYGLRPKDVRVYGHFALAKAMREDWIGVKEDLLLMRNFNPEDCDTFKACFTPILKLYFKSHCIAESEDFIRFYVEECDLRLNAYITNLMINAYAKAKEMDSLIRWINFAANQGVTIDSVTFNTLLNNLYRSWGFSYGDVLTFYRKIRSMDAASFILMDNDTSSILRRLAILDGTREDTVTKRLSKIKSTNQPMNTLDPGDIHLKMSMAFGKGNTAATLEIYKCAQKMKIHLGPEHLLLAVRASLKLFDQEPGKTTSLIRDAQVEGLDVSLSVAAVFMHQLTEMREAGERDPGVIVRMTMSTVSLFQSSDITVPLSVLTHTASILQRNGHNRQTIDFWNTMTCSLGFPPSSMDIAAYTVLCKAYSAILDDSGVGSIIEAIRVNNITPDSRFKVMLKTVQKDILEFLVDRPNNEKALRFLECILEARQQVKEMRADAMSAKAEVQWKAIQIIEKAVEEQILHGRRSEFIDERSSKLVVTGKVTGVEDGLQALSSEEYRDDAWLREDAVIATRNRHVAVSQAG